MNGQIEPINEVQISPAEMIREAVKGSADLDKLGKLLEMQREWEANEARKTFTESFAKVQSEILAVARTKNNPQTHSKYAPLEDIIESAKPIYAKEGFSMIFYEGKADQPTEYIRVCADVVHRAGHKETFYYDVPFDGIGIKGNPNMTKIHGKASSVSYGRRYLMCMILNIPTRDDNDGNIPKSEAISAEDANKLLSQINDLSINLDLFLEFMSVEKIEDISKENLKKAQMAIETARAKRAKK